MRDAEANKAPGSTDLTEAVARYAFKLMAYKDEYEVARLYTSGDFQRKLEQQYEGDYKLKFHLAPPLLAKKDAQGRLIKQEFGAWVLTAFKLMAKLKFLRGGALDIFGYTAERRMERQLIGDYEQTVDRPAGHARRRQRRPRRRDRLDPRAHPRLRPRQGSAPARGQGARGRVAGAVEQPAEDRAGGVSATARWQPEPRATRAGPL